MVKEVDMEAKKCPIDSEGLSAMSLEGLGVTACPACSGAWLSGAGTGLMFSRMADGAGQQRKLRESLRVEGRKSKLACVDCGIDMRTVTQRGVEIDVCPDCTGIWFDGGELKRFRKSGFSKAAKVGAAVAGGAA